MVWGKHSRIYSEVRARIPVNPSILWPGPWLWPFARVNLPQCSLKQKASKALLLFLSCGSIQIESRMNERKLVLPTVCTRKRQMKTDSIMTVSINVYAVNLIQKETQLCCHSQSQSSSRQLRICFEYRSTIILLCKKQLSGLIQSDTKARVKGNQDIFW